MKTLNKWIAVALVAVGVVLLTVLGNRLPGQLDTTDSRTFTLSDASRGLVAELSEPVTLELYFSRSVEGIPIQFKNFATRVEDLLKQYQRVARGKLILRVIDPRPDTDDEQSAIRAGLRSQPLPTGENLFFGLVVHHADASAALPFFNMNRQSFLEYDVSQLIFQVQQLDKPVIGIISSLELEPARNAMQPMGQQNESQYAFLQELRRSSTVRILAGSEIDPDIDMLLVLHLQNADPQQLYAIDQFVLSGRPVLLAVDPSSYLQRSQQSMNAMMGMGAMPDASSSLDPLLQAWGVGFDPGQVVGDLALAASVSTQTGAAPVRFPVWLNFTQLESDSPLLATLNNLLFVEPGALNWDAANASGRTWTPLLQTTAESATLAAQMLAFSGPEQVARSLQADGVQRTLAGILQGKLMTAFPDGPPAAEDADNADDAQQDSSPSAAFLRESSRSSTVVVVADSDFFANDFSVRIMNVFGMRAINPINDNLAFLLNIVDSLSGNPELIALRGKGGAVRPFTVVQEIERSAQAAYQEQLESLEARLSEVQARLRSLQQETPNRNQLIANAETQAAIERFRLEEAEVRGEQRKIRQRLREDIEALNLRLALFNLLTAPLLIAAGGIFHFIRRKR